jgi:hypothetical protein
MVNKKAMGSQGKEAVECRGSPLANAKEFSLQDQMKKSNAHILDFDKKDRYSLGWMHSNHYLLW